MATEKSIYNYDNPKYAPLRDPMRDVMSAYGNAERFIAHIKERTWSDWGLRNLTDAIHKLEHVQPERVDVFKDILAQIGLLVEYPAVPEFIQEMPTLDDIFEVCIGVIDEIDGSLTKFIDASTKEFGALARQVEQLQIENSKDKSKLLEAWNMFNHSGSLSSFDTWCKGLFE